MRLSAGMKLGQYEILAPVGAGGMGEVYRARDGRLNRDVAVKVLPERLADSAEALARFEREAKALAALSHPNLVVIFDVGTDHGIGFAVMEFLTGETLEECLVGARFRSLALWRLGLPWPRGWPQPTPTASFTVI
jgi:eukaryotic-like serine/threonine-protein kinase